jgi:Fic family protein
MAGAIRSARLEWPPETHPCHAREHGNTFTSQAYQNLVHVDLYTASRDIKDLIRKGLIRLPKKRGRVYQLASLSTEADKPLEYTALEPILTEKGYVTNEDIRSLFRVSAPTARRFVQRLVLLGWLKPQGAARWRRYVPGR